MLRKPSEIWTHFDKKENVSGVAVCKYCNQNISYKSTSGNLGAHLKRSHASIYLAQKVSTDLGNKQQIGTIECLASTSRDTGGSIQAAAVADKETASQIPEQILNRKRQRTMQNYIIKKMSPEESKRVDRDLLELFIADFQPFRIVEDKGFKKFVKNIPGYTLPSRKNISSAMIPALYQTTLNEVKTRVSLDASSVCLTTDCWTSSQTESYIGVTVHYIDKNFEPQQILLECKGLNETHTSANLAKKLKRVTDEWNLTHKVNFAILDNARNIVKAIETARVEALWLLCSFP
ncbi:unnamed protein product [Parnassius mnemosyne]|uniref:BED-type domain-containing protein n=1 Tax=Parnassius mnemosyne TaxID=213953 RepID=A0AAV1L8C7_9NEOP